jgi:hypothetical protein
VVLGLKNGDRKFERLDIICLIGAFIGLLVLVIIKSPSLAVIVSIVTDFLGAIPTLKHAWFKPREETWITYAMFEIGSAITLLIADFHFLTAVAYPMYLLVFDSLVTGIILTSPHQRLLESHGVDHNSQNNTKEGAQVHAAPTLRSIGLIDSLVAANEDL